MEPPPPLRIVEKLDITSTFKLKKLTLQREGYNPAAISDPLFFLDAASGEYRPLDAGLYKDIANGLVRL